MLNGKQILTLQQILRDMVNQIPVSSCSGPPREEIPLDVDKAQLE